jgi:hypothetical protein
VAGSVLYWFREAETLLEPVHFYPNGFLHELDLV